MLLIGVGVFVYVKSSLNFGTLTMMGPGLFPGALGVILSAFGLWILWKGLSSADEGAEVADSEPFELKSFVAILASLVLFALTLESFGLLPAIVVMTIVSSAASDKASVKSVVGLSIALCILAYCIFKLGLNMPVSTWKWEAFA